MAHLPSLAVLALLLFARGGRAADCALLASCEACRAASCGWCLATRRCVNDAAWLCQGDVDHIGSVGTRAQCPSCDELRADYERRRAAAAALLPEEDAAAAASAAGAATAPAPGAAAAASWKPTDAEHIEDLLRRAALARSASQYGKAHPYETLGVAPSATQREVKKAYMRLATRLHPDRNPQHAAEAQAAFADVSGAHDLLSDQTLREAFDAEAAGGQAFFHDEASFQASGQQFACVLFFFCRAPRTRLPRSALTHA